MRRTVTVIVYTRSKDNAGVRLKGKKFFFWKSKSEVANNILWKLIDEIDLNNAVITGVQII